MHDTQYFDSDIFINLKHMNMFFHHALVSKIHVTPDFTLLY